MRLIDADKVVRYTCTIDRDHDYDVYDIEHAPTVDAVPVVRCKDCIHRPVGDPCEHDVQPSKENDYRCPCLCEDDWYSWIPDDDWFCANGETE